MPLFNDKKWALFRRRLFDSPVKIIGLQCLIALGYAYMYKTNDQYTNETSEILNSLRGLPPKRPVNKIVLKELEQIQSTYGKYVEPLKSYNIFRLSEDGVVGVTRKCIFDLDKNREVDLLFIGKSTGWVFVVSSVEVIDRSRLDALQNPK